MVRLYSPQVLDWRRERTQLYPLRDFRFNARPNRHSSWAGVIPAFGGRREPESRRKGGFQTRRYQIPASAGMTLLAFAILLSFM